MRIGSQPVAVGFPENPWPGNEGMTRWKASAALGAMGRWITQRLDDLELLDRRAGPAVRDDQRERVLVLRANVDEVDVDAIDLGDEMRQGLEARLERAPVVVARPVLGQCLDRLEPNALRRIGFAVGPSGCEDAPAQVMSSSSETSNVNGRIASRAAGCVGVCDIGDSFDGRALRGMRPRWALGIR